jgi:hypothetical protein
LLYFVRMEEMLVANFGVHFFVFFLRHDSSPCKSSDNEG